MTARWLLLLALLLPLQANAAVVQSVIDASTTPWVTDAVAELTFGSDFTVGNTVCVGFGMDASSRTISSVEDDGGPTNTYTLAATVENPGSSEAWMYCGIVERAANVITVTISSALASPGAIFGWEISGARASASVGNTATNLSSATTSHPAPVSGTLALTDATAQLLGFSYGSTGTYTIDAGFTELWNRNVGTGGYQSVSAADSMVNTTGGNESANNLLVEIRPAAAGGAETFGFRLRLAQ